MIGKCKTGVLSVLALSITLMFATVAVNAAENQDQKEKEHKEQKEHPKKEEGGAERRKPKERAPEPKEVRPFPGRSRENLKDQGEVRPAPGRGGEPGAPAEQVRPARRGWGTGRPLGNQNPETGGAVAPKGKDERVNPPSPPTNQRKWDKARPEPDQKRTPPASAPAASGKEPLRSRPVFTLPPDVKRAPGGTAVLPKGHADNVLRQVNSARSNLRGVNARPVPPGRVSTRRDGGLVVEASKGRKYQLRPDGTIASFSARGRSAEFRPNGRIRHLETGNLRINRGAHNERRIVTVRPDRTVLVSTGPHRGYLERRVAYNNVTLVRRTYVVNQTTYTQIYTPRYYNGVEIQVFLPRAYYPPAYYGWAVDPWGRPVRYSWGWVRDPWYGYYGSYYRPATVYPSASAWLTDYLLAETLRSAYYDQGGQPPVDPDPYGNDQDYPITPAVKGMLVREVSRQLAEEREAARYGGYGASGLPWALREPDRMFVVSAPLDVNNDYGEACSLSAGDVLRVTAPVDGSGTAELRVMSRRIGDCAAHSTVTIGLNDLQEMNNAMRVRMYAGLDQLRRPQDDYASLPPAPADALSAPRPSEAASLPPSNENVLAMLRTQETEADQAEQQVMDSAFTEEPAGSEPPPAADDNAPAEDSYRYPAEDNYR